MFVFVLSWVTSAALTIGHFNYRTQCPMSPDPKTLSLRVMPHCCDLRQDRRAAGQAHTLTVTMVALSAS